MVDGHPGNIPVKFFGKLAKDELSLKLDWSDHPMKI